MTCDDFERRAGQTVGGAVPGAIRPQREARMGAMPDTMPPAPRPSVYRLRVVVRGVNPLIWRRLLIPADTTIADCTNGIMESPIRTNLTRSHFRQSR